jgi:hypothetical protein
MAATFQRLVIIIAILTMIVSLGFVYYMIHTETKSKWPPIVAKCPDFWDAYEDSSGKLMCKNTKRLGTCLTDFDPNAEDYKTDCQKYTWANKCDIKWDGINYGAENPCIKKED